MWLRKRFGLLPPVFSAAILAALVITPPATLHAGVTGNAPAGANVPSTQPSADPVLCQWIDELDDADPTVRDGARFNLMGLTRHQLPQLRAAVQQSLPLSGQQVMALRDVFDQVFLSGDRIVMDGDHILGLFWPKTDDAETPPEEIGTSVVFLIPGLPANRYLRTGDVIVELRDYPATDCRQMEKFHEVLRDKYRGGDLVRLTVLRHGKLINLNVPVAQTIPMGSMQAEDVGAWYGATWAQGDWIKQRQKKADDAWKQQFAPLLDKPSVADVNNDREE